MIFFDYTRFEIMLFDEVLSDVYTPAEYPALDALTKEWSDTRPFEGLRILVATPIFRNTLLQYRALLAGGADLAVGRSVSEGGEGVADTSMPCDGKIVDLLVDNDIPVLTPEDVLAEESEDEYFDLILDCAGQFASCNPRYGFVELTRSGVQFYENVSAPVYVADSGIVKRIETSLGTGDGYFRALEQLGYLSSASGESSALKRLVVFGSGKVGAGLALQGLGRGLDVCVVTDTSRRGSSNDFANMLESNGIEITDVNDVSAVVEIIRYVDLVVTATGVRAALDKPEIVDALMQTSALLANMGVEDEYGENIPAERVLGEKTPLNFILEEPTHLKYIDASLALHAALGERMLQDILGAEPPMGIKNPPSELEQRILMISIQNGVAGPEICGMLGLPSEEI